MLRAIGDAGFEQRPIPKLRDAWDVRVHIAQTGICGSDLHYYDKGRIGGELSIEDWKGIENLGSISCADVWARFCPNYAHNFGS